MTMASDNLWRHISNGFGKLLSLEKYKQSTSPAEKYASLKIEDWNEDKVLEAVECLSRLLGEKELINIIGQYFPMVILDIVTLALDSNISHQLKCIILGKLVTKHPDILKCSLFFFEKYGPPWTEPENSSKMPKKRKVHGSVSDLEIVECCWSFLLTSVEVFKQVWNWSEFMSRFLNHSDHHIVWISCHCVATVLSMSEKQRNQLFELFFKTDEIEYYSLLYNEQLFPPTVGVIQGNIIIDEVFEPSSHITTVSNNVVNIGGISLPVYSVQDQIKSGSLVPVKSTISSLTNVAIGVTTGKAVCLVGPVGSGKTALVDHLAQVTGRTISRSFLKVQLGEETDSKMLLGSYRCTDVPGEFVWQPGILTKAVIEGAWLLLEDIDTASSDVASVLASVLENKTLSVPGFRDNIRVAPGFQLFVTHRMLTSVTGHHRKQTSATELLEKLWLQITVESLTKDELVHIIQTKFPALSTIATKMVTVYLLFSMGYHDGQESQIISGSGGRLISTRDLLKWCMRAVLEFDVSSPESGLKVFQDAIDIFCSSYNSPDVRLELASRVAASLGFIKAKAEYYCCLHKPNISLTQSSCLCGRVSLNRVISSDPATMKSDTRITFALTQASCCLLERIAVSISLCEPVLLVGETGTGKTSTLQLLAKYTGNHLTVINMNQQSDSADLLGGYKPVELKFVITPIRDEFEQLFRSYFNVEQNLKFLEHISTCYAQRRWKVLLRLMKHSQLAAITRLTETKPEGMGDKLKQWRSVGEKITRLQSQLTQGPNAMAFSFIEGTLVHALKEGHWVFLDEINLASAETLQCLSGLLEGKLSSVSLLEKGDSSEVKRHPNFRLMAAMNPATDFGKKDLPSGIRNRFTELFVSEYTEKRDLDLVVSCYLPDLAPTKVDAIVKFYLDVKKEAEQSLTDPTGHKPHYSLRTLCRALGVASSNFCGSVQRSLYEAFCLSFLTQLDTASHLKVKNMIARTAMDKEAKSIIKQPIPEPSPYGSHICFEGYWVTKGEKQQHIPEKYLLTPSVRRNLCDLARCLSLSNFPILIQGETSVGKTSLITYLAEASGHTCLRINNHQHTDLQEYVGSYCADATSGTLVFKEGVLVEAMRQGFWIILDELNLAPGEVLEALNRVLDDNRELFIAETQVTVKAHPNFRLFATQNPPGLYGGRKMLSRAFRNRFVELHFDEIPPLELENILQHRCQMPMSYCKKLVAVMMDLQMRRKGSAAFAGKQGFITLRDLFRWGERYRLANHIESTYYDWDQHLADEGFLVLAGRVRREEEVETIRQVIEKKIKRKIDLQRLFSLSAETSPVTKSILEKIVGNSLPEEFRHIVWTMNLRKLAVLLGKALEFHEPVLLVGETGCGKTTVCQLLTVLNKQQLFSVSCHQHSESSDFLGGLRPVRERVENSGRLFEWVDGPLIEAMRSGHVFMADEISLADDSVLERLNSLLEPERKLLVSEKGADGELELTAHDKFHFVGTMNPGGDFGKKELSPALRNRLTEIWCEGPNIEDIGAIIEHNVRSGLALGNQQDGTSGIGKSIIQYIDWFSKTEFGRRVTISIRNILTWVNFINVTTVEKGQISGLDVSSAYIHGCCLIMLDGFGSSSTSMENFSILKNFKSACLKFLLQQVNSNGGFHTTNLEVLLNPEKASLNVLATDKAFGIHPFYVEKGDQSIPTSQSFIFEAPTTCINALRVLRSLQIPNKAILLEGSPGVGKTSLVIALGKTIGHKVTRINLSEQTDVSDLFGADLPVEGAQGGTFAWRDGPFLKALKQGHWILLDELNLALQSVVEGLNSVLDHRGEIFIPELGRTFTVNKNTTRIFACQNPQRQGGARKGLPQSFLNRFSQVYVEELSSLDLGIILGHLYPKLNKDLVDKMVEFNQRLLDIKWTSGGGPWEWNLRDLSHWAETIHHDDPGTFVTTIYTDRIRNQDEETKVFNLYEDIFGDKYPLVKRSSPIVVTPSSIVLGEVTLSRNVANESNEFLGQTISSITDKSGELLILRSQLSALRSLALCVKQGWMSIIVGKSHSGKTSLVNVLAQLTGRKLHRLPVNSSMDTTELLGGFEQTDYGRHLEEISGGVEKLVFTANQKLLLAKEYNKSQELLGCWYDYSHMKNEDDSEYTLTKAADFFKKRILSLSNILASLPKNPEVSNSKKKLKVLEKSIDQHGIKAGGTFEWVDSILVKCLLEGSWLLVENVNLCSGSVLDRLNGLLEPNGVLVLGERGVGSEGEVTITPHPDFRLFLTMDPHHGTISRAMRNRGIEIYVETLQMESTHPLDLNALLSQSGFQLQCHRDALINVHMKMVENSQGFEEPTTKHLLQIAFLTEQNCRRGLSIHQAMNNACFEVYAKSRILTSEHKTHVITQLQDALQSQQYLLSSDLGSTKDHFLSKETTLSTLPLQEISIYSTVKQQGSLLHAFIKSCEISLKMKKSVAPLLLKDIVGCQFKRMNLEPFPSLEARMLDTIPFAVISFYNLASYNDLYLRHTWIKHITESALSNPITNKIFTKLIDISEVVFKTLTQALNKSELPWDLRLFSDEVLPRNWSHENRVHALICYKVAIATLPEDPDIIGKKINWKTISVTQYSEAVTKGVLSDLITDHPLFCKLSPLIEECDKTIISMLSSAAASLDANLCCNLLYNVAWKFRLANIGKRHLFDISFSKSNLPSISEDTRSLLLLHYKWFIKHTLPVIVKIMDSDKILRQNSSKLLNIVEAVNEEVDASKICLSSISRKLSLQMGKPLPLSSTLQCDLSKQLQKIENLFGLWGSRNSGDYRRKINFLASIEGQSLRNKLIKGSYLINMNFLLDEAASTILEAEETLKILKSDSTKIQETGNFQALSTVPFFPISEFVCLHLNTAFRRFIAEGKTNPNKLDGLLLSALERWMQWTASILPSSVGTITSTFKTDDLKETMKAVYVLTDHMTSSLAVNNPQEWLKWSELKLDEEMDYREEELVTYPLHCPMFSFFISSLVKNNIKSEDSSATSLTSYRSMTNLINSLRSLLWKSAPSIFSSYFDMCKNEEICVRANYKHLVENLLKISELQSILNSHVNELPEKEEEKVVYALELLAKREGTKDLKYMNSNLMKIVDSLKVVHSTVSKLEDCYDNDEKWILLGKSWALLGHIYILIFSSMELVDPVKKKALKMQYALQEVEELQMLLCVENIQKVILGDTGKWPFESIHERRIEGLKVKTEKLGKSVAVRPCPPLYNDIVKDIYNFTSSIAADSCLKPLLSRICTATDEKIMKKSLDESKSLLMSLNMASNKIKNLYVVTYPDIVLPPLLAMSQLNYGIRLVSSVVQKKVFKLEFSSVQDLLARLSLFPISDLDDTLKIVDDCMSQQILQLIDKNHELTGKGKAKDYVFRLAKICLRLVRGLGGTNKWYQGKNCLMKLLDHIVIIWQEHQREVEEHIAQEKSIYVNKRTDPSQKEEEEINQEIAELFPISRNIDFGDIEAAPSLEMQESSSSESPDQKNITFKLTSDDIKEVCQLHSKVVKETSIAHWIYENPMSVLEKNEDIVLAFLDRINIFTMLIEGLYVFCDNNLDRNAITGLFLACGLQLEENVSESVDSKYDFYRHPNVIEVRKCIPLLNSLINRVMELHSEWPDHPTLNQVCIIVDRVKGFDIRSPISRFLTGLELLLTKLHDWEENAHAGVSLAAHSSAVTTLIISWRKLELSAWKGSLHSASIKASGNASKWWFHLYSLVSSYINSSEDNTNTILEFVKTLETFMEGSPIGEFSARLNLLYTFHCHCLTFKPSQKQSELCSVLWNLYLYYHQFVDEVSKRLKDLSSAVEKNLKDFVKIARWNDISYWAIKTTVEKSHRTLHKHIKDFQNILNQPANLAMTRVQGIKGEPHKMEILRNLDCKLYISNINCGVVEIIDDNPDTLLSRQELLLSKAKNICRKIFKNCPYPTLMENLGEVVEESSAVDSLLRELDINPALPMDKKRSAAKSLLQRKRKAVADMFRTLSLIGLSYRSGLVACENKINTFALLPPLDLRIALQQMDKRTCDKELLNSWKNTEAYFLASVAHLAQLDAGLKKPHKDLGPPSIERVKGFATHLMNLCEEQKATLHEVSLPFYTLRCHISQLCKLNGMETYVNGKTFVEYKDELKNIIDDIEFCLDQFLVILNSCPENTVLDANSSSIPTILSDELLHKMASIGKHDTLWESINSKVKNILDSKRKLKSQILTAEKHYLFVKSLHRLDIDSPSTYEDPLRYVVDTEQYKILNDGYTELKRIIHILNEIQHFFDVTSDEVQLKNPLSLSLWHLENKVNNFIAKHASLFINSTPEEEESQLCTSDLKSLQIKAESIVNKTLFIIQEMYKTYQEKKSEDEKEQEEPDGVEDNHLKQKIKEQLRLDLMNLRIKEISDDVISIVQIHVDLNSQDKMKGQKILLQCVSFLDQLSLLYQFFINQQTLALKVSSKLTCSLLEAFIYFAHNGYNVPEELREEEEKEGEEKVSGGMGLGEGEGEKDVSDQIETQDQLEDAKKPDDYEKKEEDKDCKEEDKGIEMTDDFDGKVQDIEEKEDEDNENNEENDENKNEELDKEMGDTGKEADVLDEQIWGNDSEDENENNDKDLSEDEHDKGVQEGEKEMGAKDENKKPLEDEEKNEQKQGEDKRQEINEIEERGIDEEHIDPYHGNMPSPAEPEPFELEDNLQLDSDKEGNLSESEQGDDENPFDIDTMKEEIPENNTNDENEETDKNQDNKGESESEEEESDNGDQNPSHPTDEIGKDEEETGEDTGVKDKIEEDEKQEDEKPSEDNKHEEALGSEDKPSENVAEGSEQKYGSSDQVTKPQDKDSETITADEQSTAEGKDEVGVGQAQEEADKGGHSGSVGKGTTKGTRKKEEKRDRPGQSEMERSLGESSEPQKKKLKTIGINKDDENESEKKDVDTINDDETADLYQHIHEAKQSQHDTQTTDAATKEQAEKQPVPNKEDEEGDTPEDQPMELDEEEAIEEISADSKLDPETFNEKEESELKQKTKQKGDGDAMEEAGVEVEGDYILTSTVERGHESTYHTRPQEMIEDMCFLSTESILDIRSQLESQLASWNQPPVSVEAAHAWEKLCHVTSGLARDLSEQLRLVLEPTTASGLKGDFRTGRRINMRKVIPYIASQFRKDKIWLRRTKPSKREYQIVLAIDDSSSMADNHSKELAFESLALVSKALGLLEAGDLSVVSFGESINVLHKLGESFTEHSGARLLQQFSFEQKKTKVGALVDFACAYLGTNSKNTDADIAQLLVIVSDGRGVLSEGEASVRAAVRKAKHQQIFMVFVIIDNPNSKDSILDIRMPCFREGKLLEISPYMDHFPFPFYLILRDINNLPVVLSDALRQWFELVTNIR